MEELNNLRRSSLRSSVISLVGLVIFIFALLFSSYNLFEINKSYKIVQSNLKGATDSLKAEKQKVYGLKQDELKLNEYLINLLNSTQANQGNPLRQSQINWGNIKHTITALPSGKRKLALTIALLTTWKEIPFKLGINKPKLGYDSPGYIQYILNQVGINIQLNKGQKLSEAIISKFKKVEDPLPGDLIFYQARGKDEIGNFGLIYVCPGNPNGKGIAIGTLDTPDPLNIYDTSEISDPTAFLGYYRINY